MAPPDEDRGAFAERLDKLFDLLRDPAGHERSLAEIADETARLGPVTVSPQHLSRLRAGTSRNPGLDQMVAIANAFGINPKYFIGPAEEVVRLAAEVELLDAVRDARRKDVLLRASRLSTEGLMVLASTIAGLEQMEGRDDLPRSKRRRVPPRGGAPEERASKD